MTVRDFPPRLPGAALDPDAVELANAYGPYSHGAWVGPDIAVGNEESFAGRGAFLVSLIRGAILERFTVEQLRTMTLVDVGSYDGWLLCQLEDLPFRSMIGIEPRDKNLTKGRMIRTLLGVETRCEFRKGSIETLDAVLGGQKADVVLCAGLLHHLPSIAEGVARLRAICRHLLFLDTLCLPSAIEDERLRTALELKDLPYFFGDHGFGVTGYKLESGYYDGSALGMSVVSLPSIGALRLFLRVHGFSDIRVVADPAAYAGAVKGGWRQFSAACLVAEIDPGHDANREVAAWVGEYEGGLMRTLLPQSLARGLYDRHSLGRRGASADTWLVRVVSGSGVRSSWLQTIWQRLMQRSLRDRYALEICRNLRHAPKDKAALEYGKCLLAQRRHVEAEQVLLGITRRPNADWRSVYRAFCLLAWSFRDRSDLDRAARYVELCRTANPQFPESLLNGSIALFRHFGRDEPVQASQ